MSVKRWVGFLLSFFFCFFFIYPAGRIVLVYGAELSLDDQASGDPNTLVTFTMRVNDAPNEVTSFGLELSFDPNILAYTGFARGDLTTDYDAFNANLISPKVLKVGGVEVGKDAIQAGASGGMVLVNFRVRKAGLKSILSLSNLKDDIASWTTDNGELADSPAPDSENTEEEEPADSSAQDKKDAKCFIKVLGSF